MVGENSDIRIDIDDRAQSVSKRIKMAHKEGIPHILVVGEKEQYSKEAISIFDVVRSSMDIDVPYIPISWPNRLSLQYRM